MLATGGVILTTAGSLLISRSLELVKPIEFTHMKIGTGDISSIAQARKLNDLVASYKNINMSTLVRSGDLVRVRGSFTNDEITETVRIKEVGVFATIGTEQPILFGYVNDGEGELIPPGTSGIIARTRDLYIGVTGEAEVAITINKSLVYATIEDLEEGLNRKEDKFVKRSGWNLEKTDLTENDSNKLFTAKGALNLFNTLTTNFTNGINAAKEVLRLDIVKKLNKGAYLGDAQDLKNEIDTKVSKTGDTMTGSLGIKTGGPTQLILSRNSLKNSNNNIKFQYTDAAYYFGFVNGVLKIGEIEDLTSGYALYHTGFKPTPEAIGAEPSITKKTGFNLDKTDSTENDSNKLFSAKGALNLFNTLTTNFTNAINTAKETLRLDIVKKLSKDGDTMTGRLQVPNIVITDSGMGILNAVGGNMVRNASGDKQLTVIGNESGKTIIDTISNPTVRVGATGEKFIYHEGNKPTPVEIGALNREGDTLGKTLATPLTLLRDAAADNLNIRFYLPQQKIDKYLGVSSSGKFAIDSSADLGNSSNNIVTENEDVFFKKTINLGSGTVIKNNIGNNIVRISGNATILGAESGSIPSDALTVLVAGADDKAVVRVKSGASSVDRRIYHTGNRARAVSTHMFTVDTVNTGGFYAGSISEYDFIFIKYNFDRSDSASRTMNSAITIPSDYRGEVPLTVFLDNVNQHIMLSLENGGIRVRATNDSTNTLVVFGVKII